MIVLASACALSAAEPAFANTIKIFDVGARLPRRADDDAKSKRDCLINTDSPAPQVLLPETQIPFSDRSLPADDIGVLAPDDDTRVPCTEPENREGTWEGGGVSLSAGGGFWRRHSSRSHLPTSPALARVSALQSTPHDGDDTIIDLDDLQTGIAAAGGGPFGEDEFPFGNSDLLITLAALTDPSGNDDGGFEGVHPLFFDRPNNIESDPLTPVPEPATLLLLGGGLAAGLGTRKRRR